MTYAVSNYLLVNETGLGQALFVQFFEILVTFGPLLLLRAAPYEGGLISIARRYVGSLGTGLRQYPVFWERIMLGLVLIVAALLRLLRLGNLFTRLDAPGASNELKQISGDLGVFLTDPQGLREPFVALQQMLVRIFGPTPLAVLLPSAVLGTLTVLVIFLLTKEIMHQGRLPGAYGVALLAALLAATSRWHVSLSRSGTEIVLLPLLICTALYWLLVAFRLGAQASGELPPTSQAADPIKRERARRRQWRLCLLLYAGCGVCTGLASDLAPGLWLLPLLVIGFLLIWRRRVPAWFTSVRWRISALLSGAMISGLPAMGYLVGRQIGFPAGSPIFARASEPPHRGPTFFSLPFWAQVAQNVGGVVRVLIAQDYTAGYPSVGATPIIPILLAPVFIFGVIVILVRWHNLASLALLLLVALPLVASVAVGSSANVIEAACVLPATCIIPALALYEISVFFGHLPIVLDRVNGARVFGTPEQIGRVLLLIFLTISTIRTFYWYFEATLPVKPPNDYIPTYVAPPPAHAALVALPSSAALPMRGDFTRMGLPGTAAAGIVLTWQHETSSAPAE
jgi:4-amino-4-deoxy-L-arabinose transferase-like glycosyltransferase